MIMAVVLVILLFLKCPQKKNRLAGRTDKPIDLKHECYMAVTSPGFPNECATTKHL
jgi:hypothetical protein